MPGEQEGGKEGRKGGREGGRKERKNKIRLAFTLFWYPALQARSNGEDRNVLSPFLSG